MRLSVIIILLVSLSVAIVEGNLLVERSDSVKKVNTHGSRQRNHQCRRMPLCIRDKTLFCLKSLSPICFARRSNYSPTRNLKHHLEGNTIRRATITSKPFPRKPLYKERETGHLVSEQTAGLDVTVERARSIVTSRLARSRRYVCDPVNRVSCVCDPCLFVNR